VTFSHLSRDVRSSFSSTNILNELRSRGYKLVSISQEPIPSIHIADKLPKEKQDEVIAIVKNIQPVFLDIQVVFDQDII
jgi:hypothetical protein